MQQNKKCVIKAVKFKQKKTWNCTKQL